MVFLKRGLMVAALAAGVLGGGAALQAAQAQHVVTEQEAGKLSFDSLTASPARSYVHQAQYYRHRHYPPPRRFRHHRFYR